MDPENPEEIAAPSTQELLQTLVAKLTGWLEAFVANLPNLVIALILMTVAWFVSRWVARAVRSFLERISRNRQLADLIGSVTRIAVLGVALFAALGILQLDKTVTSLLAGVGILGIALGFAVQDLVANLISGSIMAVRRPFRVGDLIETNDYTAVVKTVDLRETHFTLLTGEALTIPNNQIFSNPIINRTRVSRRRIDLEVGVAYGDDLKAARTAMLDALHDLPGQTADEPEVYFTGFGGSSIDAVARFWVNTTSQAKWLNARSEAIIGIKSSLDEAGITIPFPIRTLDFGVVGGEPLADHMADYRPSQPDESNSNPEDVPAAAK